MTVDQLGRAYQTYRRTAGSRSMAALLIANAIPLIGVLFFGWSLLTILVIYWLENGIVGLWNVPKILLARGSVVPTLPPLPDSAALAATGSPQAAADLQAAWQRARAAQLQAAAEAASPSAPASGSADRSPASADGSPASATGAMGRPVRAFGSSLASSAGRAGLAIFFVLHYGIFWFVHGVFVFTLPLFLGGAGAECIAGQPTFPAGTPGGFPVLETCPSGPFGEVLWTNVAIAGIALFVSHGASFLFNYVGRGEYLTASPTGQMGAVYGRVIVLHLTILFGAFAVAILGSPVAALLLLVGLKTAFDLSLHRRERRAADARVPADTDFGKLVRDG